MAEYSVVMRNLGRMCESYGNCWDGCPVKMSDGACFLAATQLTQEKIEESERIVMTWAAEHPEPVYPTWGDWLAEQSVVIKDKIGESTYRYNTLRKMSTPIPADIAEKLGIEPKEDT